jgi:ring-1,2-phenylacetyl-CoA epoxidase subunit PaaA
MNVGTDRSEKVVVETPEEFARMPDAFRELAIKQLMVHTEGELSGADDYMEIFYPMTSDPFEKAVCCERAVEELDHYERGAKILADIGVDASSMIDVPLQERNLYATEAVKECHTWAERALFSFLGETAVLEILKEMANSSYRPIAEMCVPVIKDEQVHVAHGFRIAREMCRTESGRREVQRALEVRWPITLDLFGKSNSERSRQYVRWGLRSFTNEEARARFSAMMRPRVQKLGLEVPDDAANRKFA